MQTKLDGSIKILSCQIVNYKLDLKFLSKYFPNFPLCFLFPTDDIIGSYPL